MRPHRRITLPRHPGTVLASVACLVVAAIAILPGVTRASWVSGAELDDPTISSGSLRAVPGDMTWDRPMLGRYADAGANAEPGPDLKGFRIEPGDVVVVAVPFTIEGEGDNLQATVSIGAWKLDTPNDFYGVVNLYRGAWKASDIIPHQSIDSIGFNSTAIPVQDIAKLGESFTIVVNIRYRSETGPQDVWAREGVIYDLPIALDVHQVRE